MLKIFSTETSLSDVPIITTASASSFLRYKNSDVCLISALSPFAISDSVESPNINKSLDYLWENYSENFSLLQYYNEVKGYEKKYGYSSKELFEQWKKGVAVFRDIYVNDWLNKYLQIKDFVP